MAAEIVDAREFNKGLKALERIMADLEKIVEEVTVVQRLTLDACIQEMMALINLLRECNVLEIECEDAAKYEESLCNLIDAAPLEEIQKIELKRETEEKFRFENYWKQKEHNREVAAIIVGAVVSLLAALIGVIGNSGTTINIDSLTIVTEDAESVEDVIAQMEELLDKLQDE